MTTIKQLYFPVFKPTQGIRKRVYFKGTEEMHQSNIWNKHWKELQRKETCNPALFFKRKKKLTKEKDFRINTGSETTIRSQNNDVRKNNSKQKQLKKLEAKTERNPEAKMKRMSEIQLLKDNYSMYFLPYFKLLIQESKLSTNVNQNFKLRNSVSLTA